VLELLLAALKLELGTQTLDSPVRERDLGARERSGQELGFYEHVPELDLEVVERELEAWEVDFAAREVDLEVRGREFGILACGGSLLALYGG